MFSMGIQREGFKAASVSQRQLSLIPVTGTTTKVAFYQQFKALKDPERRKIIGSRAPCKSIFVKVFRGE